MANNTGKVCQSETDTRSMTSFSKEQKVKTRTAAATPLTIESWPVEKLVPYLGNARRLSDRAISIVAASIREYGWRQPIVVDKQGVVIVGHTRLLAAKALGLETVPVHVAANLTPQQVAAYRLMDNRSGHETNWNKELLAPELAKLEKKAYDLALTGFSEQELNRFLRANYGTEALRQSEETPRLSNGRFRGRGEVWLLGSHRLICADGDGLDVAAIIECWEKFTGDKARLQQ